MRSENTVPARRVRITAKKQLFDSVDDLSTAEPGQIQSVVARQTRILTAYYDIVRSQAETSFRWALVAAALGLLFYALAAAYLLTTEQMAGATLGVIGGSIIEMLAGGMLVLYGRSASQMAEYRPSLERLQRYLLADSISEKLPIARRCEARVQLVRTIAGTGELETQVDTHRLAEGVRPQVP